MPWSTPYDSRGIAPVTATPILFIDHASALGGAENSLLLLLKHLDRLRWEPHLACCNGALIEQARSLSVRTYVVEMPRLRRSLQAPFYWMSTATRIMHIARNLGACCLYANTVRAVLYAAPAARLTHIPLIWHMRDFWLSEATPRYKSTDAMLKRLLSASAARVIVNSEAVARHMPSSERLRVVHNGIEVQEYDLGIDGVVFRTQYDIPPGMPLIGMVGRLRPWKGQSRFLQIAAAVKAKCPSTHFVIVGGTPFGDPEGYTAELIQLAHRLGVSENVTFTGHLGDVRPALAAMDVYVHPGDPEPFGLVNIEAMAMQKPVVAFAHGALPEIVDSGVTGVLVPPGDVAAMTDAILGLLESPEARQSYGQAARARVESHFDVVVTASRVDRMLTDTIMVAS